MGLFTHYKSFVQIFYQAQQGQQGGGNPIAGFYAERFTGGRVELAVAEASPAARPGRWYRSTRFRVGDITIEAYASKEHLEKIIPTLNELYKDRAAKSRLAVKRTVVSDGFPDGNNKYVEEYLNCSLIEPPQIEDTDVTRDTDFVMLTLRLQPESKKIYIGGNVVANYDANATIAQSQQGGFTNP